MRATVKEGDSLAVFRRCSACGRRIGGL